MQVSILQAKTDFSKLVRILESKQEDAVIISRYGKPIVQITLYKDVPVSKRIGVDSLI